MIEYHVGTSHGLSAEGCGGKDALLGGIEEGNVFSGSARRNV